MPSAGLPVAWEGRACHHSTAGQCGHNRRVLSDNAAIRRLLPWSGRTWAGPHPRSRHPGTRRSWARPSPPHRLPRARPPPRRAWPSRVRQQVLPGHGHLPRRQPRRKPVPAPSACAGPMCRSPHFRMV